MNKAKFYPWIFAVVFGIVGIIICPLMGNLYHNLAKDVKWSDMKEAGLRDLNEAGWIFFFLGLISYLILFHYAIFIRVIKVLDKYSATLSPSGIARLSLLGIGGCLFFMVILIDSSTDGCSLATGVFFFFTYWSNLRRNC